MTASCLTSKGQVTVPKAIRDNLGIGPGSRVRFAQEGKRVYLSPEPKPAKSDAPRLKRASAPSSACLSQA